MRISDWSSDLCSAERQEGARLETRIGEGVDEALHHVGADHVGAVARDAPARQVEAVGDMALARNAARANVIADGRRVAERRALVAADQVEPGERSEEHTSELKPLMRSSYAVFCL